MKILFILLIATSTAAQSKLIQTCSFNLNGRYNEWRLIDSSKIELPKTVHDTIYLDPALWPERLKSQRNVLDTSVSMAHVFKLGAHVLHESLTDIVGIAWDWDYETSVYKKRTTRKHYYKPRKVRVHHRYRKAKGDEDEDEYYDLYFNGVGKVIERNGGLVLIEEAKGKYYHKKSKP